MGSKNACALELACILGRNIKCSVIIITVSITTSIGPAGVTIVSITFGRPVPSYSRLLHRIVGYNSYQINLSLSVHRKTLKHNIIV